MKLKVLNSTQLDKLYKAQAKNEEKCRAEAKKLNEKLDRKFQTYMNKKELEYKRKCANEIRKLEWKPERQYKKKVTPFKTLEFAMELQQENSKLRDTDRDWNGFCISCWRLCDWHNLHWWHYISRRVKNICVHEYNINAQCRNCNLVTGPLGNVDLRDKTQAQYRANLIDKCWMDTVNAIEQKKNAYFQKWYDTNWDYGQWELPLEDWIAQAICENEMRWRNKSFYKPKKKWRKIREERNSR